MTMKYGPLILAGILSALLWLVLLENAWRLDWKHQFEALQASEKANADRNKGQLHDAASDKAIADAAVAQYVHDHPFVLSVPACPAPVRPSPAPAAGTSPPVVVAPPVSTGDRGSEGRQDQPDVALLYGAYAQVFAHALSDLKEQQAVQ